MFHREDLSIEKLERVRDEIKYCDEPRNLMLGHCGLKAFPTHIFDNDKVNTVYRLDLSHNWIADIPESIGDLTGLKELWLFDNAPLSSLPVDMQNLIHLEVLDIRNTKISEIPKEFANLTKLSEMDWRDTPLEKNLQQQYGVTVNDVFALKELLVALNERSILEVTLHEHLMGEHFLMDADNPHLKSAVDMLVEDISRAFDDLKDFKLFVKRTEKLLPPSINQLKENTVSTAKEKFYQMRRDTDRQRMAADVEIKLRGMYFDRIERSECTELLDSIFEHVKLLEDIHFLCQYAPSLLPQDPKTANGEVIWENICAFQDDLIEKRNAATTGLSAAMSQLYPEQLPAAVLEKASETARLLQIARFATKKELVKMSQLTADCSKIFPPDFASVDPVQIVTTAKETIFNK